MGGKGMTQTTRKIRRPAAPVAAICCHCGTEYTESRGQGANLVVYDLICRRWTDHCAFCGYRELAAEGSAQYDAAIDPDPSPVVAPPAQRGYVLIAVLLAGVDAVKWTAIALGLWALAYLAIDAARALGLS
jgi:hypothetical protein